MSAMLEVLIVGCGAIAGGYDAAHRGRDAVLTHAAAFRRDGRYRLAACVDPDAAKRAAFRATWEVERDFASLDAAIADAAARNRRWDVVSICSPTECHVADLRALVSMGARRPRLVFVEKPLSRAHAEAAAAIAAVEAAGIAVAVNHTRRWDPQLAQLKAELDAGTWGAIRAAVATYNKGIINNGSHMLDLLLWLLGPLQLDAAGAPVVDYRADDPSVPALLRSAAGVPVQLAVADARDYALFELTLITERGVLTMEEGGLAWRRRPVVDSPRFPGYRVLAAGERSEGGYLQAMTRAAANLHDHLAGGAPLASTGASALAAQALCERIRAAGLAHSSDPAAVSGPGQLSV